MTRGRTLTHADAADAAIVVAAELTPATLDGVAEQEQLRELYLTLLAGGRGLARDDSPEHVTGSALIFDGDVERVLLVHHGKGDFWVQPGGHWEPGDAGISATAARELREETGLAAAALAEPLQIHDLNRHALPPAFGTCRWHCDVLFVGRLAGTSFTPVVSTESRQVSWFPVDRLPPGIVADLPTRIRAAEDRLNRLNRLTAH